MKLETYRTRNGEVVVKGEGFKVIVDPLGYVLLDCGDNATKHVDWIYDQLEKAAKPKGESQ